MMKPIKAFSTSLATALSLSISQNTSAMDVEKPMPIEIDRQIITFTSIPDDILSRILPKIALENCYLLGHTNGLHSVCKGFYKIIRHNLQIDLKMKIDGFFNLDKLCLSSMEQNESFQLVMLRKIKLIYKKGTPEEVILSIPVDKAPIGYTFDLSKCGDTWQYITISIGYRKAKNPANQHKVEFWIAPRFLVKKDIDQKKADHLKVIFPEKWSEKSAFGLIWTGGWWDNLEWCEYLTNKTILQLNNWKTSYEKWIKASYPPLHFGAIRGGGDYTQHVNFFTFH